MRSALFVASVIACLIASPLGAQRRLATSSSVGLLEGVDFLSGERRSACVLGGQSEEVQRDNVSFDLEYVTNAESVYRFAETNASSQFAIGIGQKVSISFGMSNETFFSSDSAVLVIAEKVTTSSTFIRGPYSLPTKFQQLRDEKFRQQCGTDFVSELVQGGEFVVLMRAEHISADEKTKFRADLQVSMGGDDGSASYRQATQRVADNSSFHVHLVRTGGIGDLPTLTASGLIEYARRFPTMVRSSHNVAFVTLTTYDVAGRILNPDLKESLREKTLYELSAHFDRGVSLNGDINKVLQDSPAYSFRNKSDEMATLTKAALNTANYVNVILTGAQACVDRKDSCDLNLIKPAPSVPLPSTLADVGGCYVWTSEDKYCVDFRLPGKGSMMPFMAPMNPGRTWNIRATGQIFPKNGIPPSGDVASITVTVTLDVEGKKIPVSKTHRHWEDPYFELDINGVQSPTGVITGNLDISQCIWITEQRCELDRMLLTVTPAAETPPNLVLPTLVNQ